MHYITWIIFLCTDRTIENISIPCIIVTNFAAQCLYSDKQFMQTTVQSKNGHVDQEVSKL